MKRICISRNETAYRWFPLWLLLGAALAAVLLVNSIWNYVMVSRRVVVDQVRRDLWLQVATVDRAIERGGFADSRRLDALLQQVRRASKGKILWIELRSINGTAIAHAGDIASPAFSIDAILAQFRNRQSIFKIVQTGAGAVIVEALPVRLPAARSRLWLTAADQNLANLPADMGVLEIAALLDSANGVFWPIRRSLLINCSAAVALLLTLAAIALRFQSYTQGRRLQEQLEAARRVQRDLLPLAPQEVSEEFDVAAECASAAGVGGDFYDVFPVADGGLAMALGDVSGKGVPAALLTGVIHGAVRSAGWTDSSACHETVTGKMNLLLCERASRERYATMFWSYFEPKDQRLHYINAGHFPPLLFKADRAEIIRLTEGGPVLGMLPAAVYRQGSVRFDPGDILVVYSDGIIETANAAGEQFGEERLLEAVAFCRNQAAGSIRNQILASLDLFSRGGEPEDDRTLLVIRFVGAVAVPESTASLEHAAEAA